MPSDLLDLASIGRLPAPGDNAAIAVRRLEAGSVVRIGGRDRTLRHTVLEGHRFAVAPVKRGEPLLSWGLPFGIALVPIEPGDTLANASMLAALATRSVTASLPAVPNFEDRLVPFVLDEAGFRPSPPVERAAAPRTFEGYRRAGSRGVGTRNVVVVLGTSSRTGAFVRELAARLRVLARLHPGLDGVVAVAHTEGGGSGEPNNAAEVLRALAGFTVHPNVAAVLAVDHGDEPITNARLRDFMERGGYPLGEVVHRFLSIRDGIAGAFSAGEAIVRGWLAEASAHRRSTQPLSGLRIALQCGGSDAFSGVSGNPLAGAVAHELIRNGGSANLCESDEAMGGESYLLQNVRDLATARAFLGKLDGFRERLGWHGVTAESNPSGGNKLRGLYNIALKSLGAVHKKDPRTRLDAVIDYAQPMGEPGFYFMNSPGNDLEGIAGQVAAGCNLIVFVTGNGSVTNFPFVPTLKVTTTTRRHELLVHEMDVNAGRYLDGEPMEALAADMFERVCSAASGARTQGEKAGHSQVSLWRDWRQTGTAALAALASRPAPSGVPIPVDAGSPRSRAGSFRGWHSASGFATERVGLILPTSMCSAQIARMAADRLNASGEGRALGLARWVALAHTEGCGFGGEAMHRLLHRTYLGYATHPNIARALFLEHGCEKVPSDVMRHEILRTGGDPGKFGWASVQLDGGIEKAIGKIEAWFRGSGPAAAVPADGTAGLLRVALLTESPLGPRAAAALTAVARTVLAGGGTVLLREGDPLLASDPFATGLLRSKPVRPTLAYGQAAALPGLHLVATETAHWVENLTGLGACGAHVFLTAGNGRPAVGHPFVPTVGVAEGAEAGEFDVLLAGDPRGDEDALFERIRAVLAGQAPGAAGAGLTDFQLTRGLLGVST